MNEAACKPATRAFAAVLALSLGLGGCGTMGGPASSVAQSVNPVYYPRCYEPVAYLRQSEERMRQTVINSAVAGAVAGGLIGALTGHNTRDALVGAAAGAAIAGAGSYYMQKQQQASEDNARFAGYIGEFDRTIASAKQAQGCYQKEYQALLKAKRAKRMPDSEGRARLGEIVAGLNETNALMAAVDGRVGENLNAYSQTYESDLQKSGIARSDVKVAAAKPRARAQVPAEAIKTEQQIKKATDQRDESRLIVSRGNGLVRDICNNPDMGDWGPGNACQTKGT